MSTAEPREDPSPAPARFAPSHAVTRPGSISFLQFWGKAEPNESAKHGWHPIAYHSLDVAACVDALLLARPLALEKGTALLGTSPDDTRAFLCALAALHDLGKFGNSFQSKRPDLSPLRALGVDASRVAQSPHTRDGIHLWRERLSPQFASRLLADTRASVLMPLMHSVFGHHGRPLPSHSSTPIETLFHPSAIEAAESCCAAMLDAILRTPVSALASLTDRRARIASWWLAGLITVADWIGSNQSWFNYEAPNDLPLVDYWQRAQQRACEAIRRAGVAPPTVAALRSFEALSGLVAATPAQEWAFSTPLPEGPVLVILEDATGSGKTEAAHMLVHRLMASGRASGAYWAMPTQATANAMYVRQESLIAALFGEGNAGRPTLILAHGQARLHRRFRASVLGVDPSAAGATRTSEAMSDDIPSTVWCSAFLADDRRSSFLADVGSGTLDQALLGALPSKFNTVRLFGLSDKVLVVDEAHAYDAYTGTELQRLLSFQAALGGSAIVLSATLTAEKRRELVDAWREGLGTRPPGEVRVRRPLDEAIADPYPLASVYAPVRNSADHHAFAAAPWSTRRVLVRFVDALDSVAAEVVHAARAGAAVAWVRNTVDSALRAAALLNSQGLTPLVFHARLAQCDRQGREGQVMRLFGEQSSDVERRGRVLVATQVIEQSLDLDFDFLVSDLAPIDLLIQRAGRLWRHARRNASRPLRLRPELVVLSPAPNEDASAGWLSALLPGTDRVYANGGVLWRSARVLLAAGAIDVPAGLRSLVETVYGSEECPVDLQRSADRAEGRERANAGVANYGSLRVREGYHGDATAWVDDVRMPTRVGEEQSTLRLGRLTATGAIIPWLDDSDVPEWKRWALSEVRVWASRVPQNAQVTAALQNAVDAVRANWGRFEREIPLLPLMSKDAGMWRGSLTVPGSRAEIHVRYSRELGLEFEP